MFPYLNKILLVDDDAFSIDLLAKDLKDIANNIIVCYDGTSAISRLKENDDIELIITDFRMPKLDGGHIISHVLENRFNRQGRHIPIIVISGYSDILEKIKDEKLCIKTVNKPYTARKIKRLISAMVDNCEIQLIQNSINNINKVFQGLRKCFEKLDKLKSEG